MAAEVGRLRGRAEQAGAASRATRLGAVHGLLPMAAGALHPAVEVQRQRGPGCEEPELPVLQLLNCLVLQASKCNDDDCCVDVIHPNHSNNYAGCKDGYVFASGGPGSCWDGGAQYERTLCCAASASAPVVTTNPDISGVLNPPGHWKYMISYKQSEAKDFARSLHTLFEVSGGSAFLDMEFTGDLRQ